MHPTNVLFDLFTKTCFETSKCSRKIFKTSDNNEHTNFEIIKNEVVKTSLTCKKIMFNQHKQSKQLRNTHNNLKTPK